MEKVCRQRVSRERKVSGGVEEQECSAEDVHDESSETGQNDLRCHVRLTTDIAYMSHIVYEELRTRVV